jgi:hypothetical protein
MNSQAYFLLVIAQRKSKLLFVLFHLNLALLMQFLIKERYNSNKMLNSLNNANILPKLCSLLNILKVLEQHETPREYLLIFQV